MRYEHSLILGTHNDHPTHLQECIKSLLHQENVNQEIIIPLVTDDKNYRTLEEWAKIINKEAVYTEVKIIPVERRDHPGHSPEGSFFQINQGLPHATKEWVRWFSGNDTIFPWSTYKQIERLQETGNKVCYSAQFQTNYGGSPNYRLTFHPYSRQRHQTHNFIADVSLWHRSLMKHTPFRWQELGNYSFWDFWLRVYEEEGNTFEYMETPTWIYRTHHDAMHIERRKNHAKHTEYMTAKRHKFISRHPMKLHPQKP